MQTYLNNISNYFERIMQIADYYGYKNPNDFAKNALNYSSPEKINRLKDENKKPSIDILIDISNKFEEISMDWLLKGKGEMFKKDNKSSYQVIETELVAREKEIKRLEKDDFTKYALEMIKDLSAENALLKAELAKYKNKNHPSILEK